MKGYGPAWFCLAMALVNLPSAVGGRPLNIFAMGWCLAFALAIAVDVRGSRR